MIIERDLWAHLLERLSFLEPRTCQFMSFPLLNAIVDILRETVGALDLARGSAIESRGIPADGWGLLSHSPPNLWS
jgi:hypothetical protein